MNLDCHKAYYTIKDKEMKCIVDTRYVTEIAYIWRKKINLVKQRSVKYA